MPGAPPTGSPATAPVERDADLLFGALRATFRCRVLLLSLAGVAVAGLGDRLLSAWLPAPANPVAEMVSRAALELPGPLVDPARDLARLWAGLVGPWVAALAPGPLGPWPRLAAGLLGLWRLGVWALLGAAATRVAATLLAGSDAPPVGRTLRRAARHWAPQAGPLLAAVGLTAALLGAVALVGWAARWPGLGVAAVLVWPLVVLPALLAVLLGGGMAIGGPLAWGAMAAERPDPFDATSVVYAYTFQRPLLLAWRVALAAGLGLIASAMVGMVTDFTLQGATAAFAQGLWEPGLERLSAGEVGATWRYWTDALAAAPRVWCAAYFWSATAAVYLLMRRDVDEKPTDAPLEA